MGFEAHMSQKNDGIPGNSIEVQPHLQADELDAVGGS
jgi:hypothetical protein